jgi:transposase
MSHDTENRETAESQAAVRLRVPERRQMAMVVQCPDDLVPAQHPARMVMELVETLDVAPFPNPSGRAKEWRGATPPICGCWWGCGCMPVFAAFGSARELARRSEESAAFRWMCGGVTVNHRLLSDFRVDHGAALDGCSIR